MEMKSVLFNIFLVQAIIHSGNFAIAQHSVGPIYQNFKCRNTGDFKGNNYPKNRDTALDHVVQKIRTPTYYGYSFASEDAAGKDDLVNAIALCPPNIKGEACEECLKKTIPYIKQKCPKQKEAMASSLISNLNSCMMFFSNRGITAYGFDDWAWINFWSTKGYANVSLLRPAFRQLAFDLQREMSLREDFLKKFSKGTLGFGSEPPATLYMSMQCSPYLLREDCLKCLSKGVQEINTCCVDKGNVFARVVSPYCVIRYDHANFLPKSSPNIYSQPASFPTSEDNHTSPVVSYHMDAKNLG